MAESAYTQVRRFLFRHPLLTVFGAALLFRLCFGLTFISSPFRFFHSTGPKPTENASTRSPSLSATMKWPNSCTIMANANNATHMAM